MDHVVIIGNGIAGITAARHIRKNSSSKITVISGESDHFFSRTALMYIYMGHMKYEHTKPYEDWFWAKNKIELKRAWVSTIDFKGKEISLDLGDRVSYDKLILATGSQSNKFGWPGQDLRGVQGLYSFQDLELMEQNTKNIDRAVVVGGGLIGIEMAEMLLSRHIPVTYLIREEHFWDGVLPQEEAQLIDRHIKEHHIDLRANTELVEILDAGDGRVKAVKTNQGEVIDCQFVGLTVGVHPNIDLVRDTAVEVQKGILVDDYLQTSVEDVYAIGDCAQLRTPLRHRRSIEAVWYAGRMMGETVAQTITKGKTAYRPGIWFNSAKFFDIEYQTYGNVSNTPEEGQRQFYWEADDHKHCLKIVFDASSDVVIGVNLFGIRSRHEVWDAWLKKQSTISYIMQRLPEANFDPEFFKKWERDIQEKFNKEYPEKAVKVHQKSFLEKLFAS